MSACEGLFFFPSFPSVRCFRQEKIEIGGGGSSWERRVSGTNAFVTREEKEVQQKRLSLHVIGGNQDRRKNRKGFLKFRSPLKFRSYPSANYQFLTFEMATLTLTYKIFPSMFDQWKGSASWQTIRV